MFHMPIQCHGLRRASLIERLPNELLLDILHYEYDGLISLRDANALDPRPSQVLIHAQSQWLSKLRVCHRWWDLICRTPAFWRVVDVYERLDWLRVCLQRAAKTSRRIVQVRLFPRALDCDDLSIIRKHVRTIRGLTLVFQGYSRGPPSPSVEALLSEPLPVPELALLNSPGLVSASSILFPALSELRLYLTAAPSPTDIQLFSGLRVLILEFCGWHVAFDQCMDVLASCSNLEVLCCTNTLALSDIPQHRSDTDSPRIVLPRLQVLKLDRERPDVTSALLRRIALPALQILHCQVSPCALMSLLQNPLEPDYSLTSAVPRPFDHAPLIPFWHELTYAELHALDGAPPRLFAWTQTAEKVYKLVELALVSNTRDASYPFDVDVAVRDFVTLFAGAPIRHLVLQANFDVVRYGETMPMLFRALPQLESLTLKGLGGAGDGLRHLWEALHPIDVEQTGSGSSVQIPCPQLQTICLDEIIVPWTMPGSHFTPGTKYLFTNMQRALQARADHGAFLQDLTISVQCPMDAEDFMTKDVQSELRALVPSFFCKVTTVGVPPLYDTDFGGHGQEFWPAEGGLDIQPLVDITAPGLDMYMQRPAYEFFPHYYY